MTFADLLVGESVFIDANVLIYHFAHHPTYGAPCRQLLQRVEGQDLLGFTSTHVLGEVAHQLMMIAEALTLPGWAPGKVKKRLHQQPGALQTLTSFRTAVESVLRSRLHVLTIAAPLLATATGIS
jgi:predicted nucleic acid-binding protein